MNEGFKRVFVRNRVGSHQSGLTYPTLMGTGIPNGVYQGKSGQMYTRSTGDTWLNVNGGYRWLKIVEI